MAKPEKTDAPAVEPVTTAPADEKAAQINPFDLPIGPPFALSQECDLIDRDDAQQLPGCYVTVRCNCGALWRANLLSEDDKECTSCRALFTHLFVMVPVDYRGALRTIMQDVAMANGLLTEEDFENEADDDAQPDDEEEDDTEEDEDPEDD